MKGLIAAGGRATRLRPITHTINKHLIPLAGRPMIEYAILKMAEAGIREIALNINPGDQEMQAALGDGKRFGVSLTYLEQEGGPRGVGHIVMNAESWIGDEPFIFYLGDNIVLGSLTALINRFERDQLDCLLALSRVEQPNRFGVPEFRDGKIIRVVEKPESPPSPYAVTGIYAYRPSVFEAARSIAPSARGEYEISDIHTALITQGKNVGFEEVTGWWKDTGKPGDLLEANALLLAQVGQSDIHPEAVIEPGARLEGVVVIGAAARISAGSVVRGPVWIGPGCVLDQADVGPDVSLGEGVRLSRTRVSRSLMLDHSTVEGGALADSLIGFATRIRLPDVPHTHRVLLGDHGVIE